jgi:RNA-directed DNA polymerase
MKHPWDSQAFAEGARAAGRSGRIYEAARIAAGRIKEKNSDLPVVLTLSHLAHLIDVSPVELRRIIDRKSDPCRWLVKMDVRHFFESIREPRVYQVFSGLGYGALVSFELSRLCTRLSQQHTAKPATSDEGESSIPYKRAPEGHLPQGAPTSPMLANLAVRQLDDILHEIGQRTGWTYSRYADDLAFSTNDPSTRGRAMEISKLAERALVRFGLEANRQKTTIVPPGARKILLGVLIDRGRPHLTRAFRNNIETHLYALAHPKIGPAAHKKTRGFASIIGMKRHIEGLIAFAHQVDAQYASRLYKMLNRVDWSASYSS